LKDYSDSLKLKDALQLYFSKYHFPNGGYNLKWFKIKLGPLFIPLPNIKARVESVKIHDIHHVITEYKANWQGEAEISGWEIASGCGRYYVAWILNFCSFFYGMILFPRELFRSFMLGRKVRSNLYHGVLYDEILLNKTVGEIRSLTKSKDKANNLTVDIFYFIVSCIFCLLSSMVFFYLICVVFHYIFTIFL
jgi:hypothetical protein